MTANARSRLQIVDVLASAWCHELRKQPEIRERFGSRHPNVLHGLVGVIVQDLLNGSTGRVPPQIAGVTVTPELRDRLVTVFHECGVPAAAAPGLTGGVLDGRIALVTGAASGIGQAIAKRCAFDGAHVIAVDQDKDGLARLAELVEVDTFVCDLADRVAVADLPSVADVVVNCAGYLHLAPAPEHDVDEFARAQQVMVTAAFQLIRAALPHMYAQGWGRIVNISSVHGHAGARLKASYVTAKFGLEGLTRVVALEGAQHGVTCNTVCPTHVAGPLVERQKVEEAALNGQDPDEYLQRVMLSQPAVPRLVQAYEVAELVAMLYGPASASMSGASYMIDGAWTAR